MKKNTTNEILLERLVKAQKLTAETRAEVLAECERGQKNIFEVLSSRKIITEDELISFLCAEFGLTPIKLDAVTIQEETLRIIPATFAMKYFVLPVSVFENTLTVAMLNPLDIMLIDDIQAIADLRVRPVIAEPTTLKKAIERYYSSKETKVAIESIQPEETIEELIKIVQETKGSEETAEFTDLMKQAQETPVIKVANLLLIDGIKRKASDVFVEPWENMIRIRYRVDGLLEEGKAPPKLMSAALVSRFKVMSQLNIAERRIPQDGRFKIKVQDREVDVRVSIIPTSFGEKVCLRILDKKTQTQSLEHLGFSAEELKQIKEVSLKPNGMILVTGPTGSGKTTTLYSMLKYLDSPEKNITTVEDPVEYQVEGINQVNIREKIGLTFPISLRSILRQDPDIVLIGEVRDFETMDIAIKAALTGHLVLSTLHTNDTCSSIVRMINMGIEPYLIASSILMVTAQRLLRRLCPHCRISYTPDEVLLQRLRLTLKSRYMFYRPTGCSRCRNIGYAGRTVVTEILLLQAELKELIMKRVPGDEIKRQARKCGMTTLRESATGKVIAGETSVDEMLRVTTGDQDLEEDLVKR
ncbi:MAG: Flp pilus assembly complex ATPase component TadA [Candidatus Omnitrophica bacterium]|nr:Flp pilus assembly complex ATPase component TadA [Candidatus Omnitrophota bacterium]